LITDLFGVGLGWGGDAWVGVTLVNWGSVAVCDCGVCGRMLCDSDIED
jgi:hypothetical protein